MGELSYELPNNLRLMIFERLGFDGEYPASQPPQREILTVVLKNGEKSAELNSIENLFYFIL